MSCLAMHACIGRSAGLFVAKKQTRRVENM